MNLVRFVKNWILPIAMAFGVIAYFLYVNIPFLELTRPFVARMVEIVQPLLIFCMLFLTFCRVDVKDLHPCKWHLWLLLIQLGAFGILSFVASLLPNNDYRVLMEAAMLCLICPTATAAAVAVRKLKGNPASVTTYTILINLMVSVAIPLCAPLVHPHPEMSFLSSFLLIIGKVFPLLLCPFVCALLLRQLLPAVHARLASFADLSFYLWAVALSLAIAMTVKTIVHSDMSWVLQAGIALVSLVCCVLQFAVGKYVGSRYGDTVTAGQALGQKNTVLIIWISYTFFTPITSIAGGFYSVWHNLINSWQLYQQRKLDEKK